MCGFGACRKTLRTVTSVVTHARMFTAKPDGDVNIFMLQVRPQPFSNGVLACKFADFPAALHLESVNRYCHDGRLRPLLRLLTLRHAQQAFPRTCAYPQ